MPESGSSEATKDVARVMVTAVLVGTLAAGAKAAAEPTRRLTRIFRDGIGESVGLKQVFGRRCGVIPCE